MSKQNTALQEVDVNDTAAFSHWMEVQLAGKIGWGGYLESRDIYRRSRDFDGRGEARSLHLGVDLWAPAGTEVFCPMAATVHGYADNRGFANYGPTIILRHQLEGLDFFTLYGHLNRSCLSDLYIGRKFGAGDKLASLGDNDENGNWPPHLHFQVITDLLGMKDDFPGVAAPSDRQQFMTICPDPDLILQCGHRKC